MHRIALCLVTCFFLSTAYAAQEARQAKVIEVKGTAEVRRAGGAWLPAKAGDMLTEKDIIRTGKKSSLLLNVDGTGETATVEIKEKSQLLLSQLSRNSTETSETTLLDLALGSVLVKAQKLHSDKSRFEIKTPTSIVGVRGTTFAVSVDAE